MTDQGESLLRVSYYPALTEIDSAHPVYWAAPHTDIDLFTILPFATERGLQLEFDGQWLNVVVPEDAFIVNVGDMLENLSNGLFISARHRVMALEPGKERFSMVFFIHPKEGSDLTPLTECVQLSGGTQRYAPGIREEFLWERLLELGIGPALLDLYAKTGHMERQLQYGRESPQVLELLLQHGLASPEVLDAVKDKQAS
jgi:isopenicillin N synthase-like dioxygenase